MPAELTRKVAAWAAEAWKYDHGTVANGAQLFAWEDDGQAIARDLHAVLGPDYQGRNALAQSTLCQAKARHQG